MLLCFTAVVCHNIRAPGSHLASVLLNLETNSIKVGANSQQTLSRDSYSNSTSWFAPKNRYKQRTPSKSHMSQHEKKAVYGWLTNGNINLQQCGQDYSKPVLLCFSYPPLKLPQKQETLVPNSLIKPLSTSWSLIVTPLITYSLSIVRRFLSTGGRLYFTHVHLNLTTDSIQI